MKKLAEAIYSAYDGDASLKSALSGGLHFGEAQQSASFPYGVFYIVSANVSHTAGQTALEGVLVQFSIFSKNHLSPVEIMDIRDKLIAVYDNLVIHTTRNYFMRRTLEHPPTRIEGVWQYSVDYDVVSAP